MVRHARLLQAERLVSGTSGNVSARAGDAFLITPSGVAYDAMRAEDVVEVDAHGNAVAGRLKPSTDTMSHLAIYRARPEVGAVIHTHSVYATVFAVLGREIPPLLAEAAGFLGGAVRVIDYVAPARPDQADRVVAGLGPGRAVLLPNHGVIAVGETLPKALTAALEVEHSARVAFLASLLGEVSPLPAEEVDRMHRFIHREYGQ